MSKEKIESTTDETLDGFVDEIPEPTDESVNIALAGKDPDLINFEETRKELNKKIAEADEVELEYIGEAVYRVAGVGEFKAGVKRKISKKLAFEFTKEKMFALGWRLNYK